MTHSLVAAPADGYQIPLPRPVTVGVIAAESESRKLFNMANMMHKRGSIDFSANLAIPMIFQENCGGKFTPFPADIKRVNVAGSDQAQKPLKKTLSHRQNKKRP